MSCPAVLPQGTPCGAATYGRTWCAKHKGLAKHYRAYKAANAAVADTVTTPPQQLDDAQLDREQTQLFTSVTQRQHLKDVGYGTASDSGHDYRIQWEGKRLSDVLTEGQRRQAQYVPPDVDDTPEVHRPAQPTSSRQQKRRKARTVTSNVNMVAKHSHEQAIRAVKHLSQDIDTTLDHMAEHLFTQRYGSMGVAIYQAALQCAYQLAHMTVYSHKSMYTGNNACSNDTIFTVPPLGFPISVITVHGLVTHGGITGANRLKMWAFFVALHSFKFSLDVNYYDKPWVPPYLIGLSRVISQGLPAITQYITYLSECLTTGNKTFREYWLKAVNDVAHATEHHLMPNIDPAFPMAMAMAGVTEWTLIYLGNDLYGYVVDDIIHSVVKLDSRCLHPRDMMINVYCDRIKRDAAVTQWIGEHTDIGLAISNVMLPFGVIVLPASVKPRDQATASELLV